MGLGRTRMRLHHLWADRSIMGCWSKSTETTRTPDGMRRRGSLERIAVRFGGVDDPASICTSHVERNNLTIRTFMRRFTRLSLGFSKKVENLRAAVALHVFHYNFCRIHSRLKRTPAMAAGVTEKPWRLRDLLG